MKRSLFYSVLLLSCHMAMASGTWEWEISRMCWNKRSNTMDLYLKVNPFTQSALYSNHNLLNFTSKSDPDLSFKIHSIHLGKKTDLTTLSEIPERVLVMIDNGASQGFQAAFENIVSTITETYSTFRIVDIIYLGTEASEIHTVSNYTLEEKLRLARSQIPEEESTYFASIFLQLKTKFRQYEKVFLLTNGIEAQSNSFRLLNQSWLLDNSIFSNTQIIPIGVKNELIPNFFQFIESLNTFSINRDNYDEIPKIDRPHDSPQPLSDRYITLRFKNKSPQLWTSSSAGFQLEFDDGQELMYLEQKGTLNHIFDPILNNQYFTNGDPIITILIIGLVIAIILFYLIPIYNRFIFKKNHVTVYGEVKKDEQAIDPLKLSPIQDLDKVVVFDDRIMLLDSWKFINKSKENIHSVQAYSDFFEPEVAGNLFFQDQPFFKYLLPGFLSIILATLTTGCFYIMSRNIGLNFDQYENAIDLPYPLSAAVIIKPLVIAMVWLIGIFMIYQYLIHRTWPEWRRSLGVFCMALLGSFLITIIYIYGVIYVFAPLAIILAHLMLGGFIAILTKYQGKLKYSEKLVKDVGMLGLFSLLSFYLIPILLLNLNIESISSFFASSSVFGIFIAGWLGKQVTSVPQRRLKLILPSGEYQIFDLATMIQNLDKILIGNGAYAKIRIPSEDEGIKERHASISKHLYKYKIQPESGKVFVNGAPIYKPHTFREGDHISLDQNATIALIAL